MWYIYEMFCLPWNLFAEYTGRSCCCVGHSPQRPPPGSRHTIAQPLLTTRFPYFLSHSLTHISLIFLVTLNNYLINQPLKSTVEKKTTSWNVNMSNYSNLLTHSAWGNIKTNTRLTAWRHMGLNYTVKTQPNSRVLLSFPVALIMKRKAEIHIYQPICA